MEDLPQPPSPHIVIEILSAITTELGVSVLGLYRRSFRSQSARPAAALYLNGGYDRRMRKMEGAVGVKGLRLSGFRAAQTH